MSGGSPVRVRSKEDKKKINCQKKAIQFYPAKCELVGRNTHSFIAIYLKVVTIMTLEGMRYTLAMVQYLKGGWRTDKNAAFQKHYLI